MKFTPLALVGGLSAALLSTASAQDNTTRPPAARPSAAPTAAPVPAATPPAQIQQPSQPVRTETVTYTNWTVTCHEVGAAPAKRNCTAVLRAIDQERKQVVMTWIFGRTPEGSLTTVLQTPTGVLLTRGVELKFGGGEVRRLTYVNCDQQRCEATIPMDDAFVQEASRAQSATASIVAKTGQVININLPVAGFDQAAAAVLKG